MTHTELTATLLDPRQKKQYYTQMTPLRRVVTPTIRLLFHLLGPIDARGVEHLPLEGPLVLAANHLTNFDVFAMQLALPRPIFFMGKAELFENPILDYVLRNLGGFPVYRGAHDEWAIQQGLRVLEQGQVLGMFPEGKRNKGKGLRPAKSGAARLALATNCRILPVAVEGTQHLVKRFPLRGQVSITVGEPIDPLPNETALALTDRVMSQLASLLPHELRGAYATRLGNRAPGD